MIKNKATFILMKTYLTILVILFTFLLTGCGSLLKETGVNSISETTINNQNLAVNLIVEEVPRTCPRYKSDIKFKIVNNSDQKKTIVFPYAPVSCKYIFQNKEGEIVEETEIGGLAILTDVIINPNDSYIGGETRFLTNRGAQDYTVTAIIEYYENEVLVSKVITADILY